MTDTKIAKFEASGHPANMVGLDLSQIKGLAQAMAASGMFQDIQKDAAKAFVKILAGQEMGIPPFQAMSDIHIIQGKATAGGNIYASRVKAHPKYDYHVKNWTERGCVIQFLEIISGKRVPLGESRFDENDAKKAGLLTNPTWSKYPRNMYFNRAMTNGVRTYCPDVFGGMAAYTPDELGDQNYIEAEESKSIIEDDGEIIHTVKTTDEPIDKSLLEDDSDPDMPPDFLRNTEKYEDDFGNDKVHEPTEDDLQGNIELPDLNETPKRKTAK